MGARKNRKSGVVEIGGVIAQTPAKGDPLGKQSVGTTTTIFEDIKTELDQLLCSLGLPAHARRDCKDVGLASLHPDPSQLVGKRAVLHVEAFQEGTITGDALLCPERETGIHHPAFGLAGAPFQCIASHGSSLFRAFAAKVPPSGACDPSPKPPSACYQARIDLTSSPQVPAGSLNQRVDMPDKLFFPLMLLIAGAIVAISLFPAVDRKPSGSVSFSAEEAAAGYQRLVIEGDELHKMIAGGEAEIEFFKSEAGRLNVSLTAGAGMLSDAPTRGPHYRLAADAENVFQNRRVRVTVRAKPGDSRGASQIRLNYSAGRPGESGWIERNLRPEFSDVSFEFVVPAKDTEELSVDYLAIRPAVPDKTRQVVIDRIVIERVTGTAGS